MTGVKDIVVEIIALSGNRLVGRTRLQKTVYLLDLCGMESGAAYYYFNFGPFSDDVANAISDAQFSGEVMESTEHRMIDGAPFSVFTGTKSLSSDKLGKIPIESAKKIIDKLAAAPSVILELAATIHWLYSIEHIVDWRSELRRRKGSKTYGGRAEEAGRLLEHLGIQIV